MMTITFSDEQVERAVGMLRHYRHLRDKYDGSEYGTPEWERHMRYRTAAHAVREVLEALGIETD